MTPTREQIEEAVKFLNAEMKKCSQPCCVELDKNICLLLSLADLYLRASEEMPEKKLQSPLSEGFTHCAVSNFMGFNEAHGIFLPIVMKLKEEISRLKKFEEMYLKASEEMPKKKYPAMIDDFRCLNCAESVDEATGNGIANEIIDACTPIVMRLKARVEFLKKELSEAEARSEWFDKLVEREFIGSKEIPSLRAYVEKLENEIANHQGGE